MSRVWRWRLQSRQDGVVWSVVASAATVISYYIVSGLFGIGTSVLVAIGFGLGTMIGGLLGTLYWLPRENGS
jgi:hypothetical protein